MKQLLEAGVHFGHQTRRWNPKMAEYIYCERNGIYIIDLQKTVKKLEEAYQFVRQLAENGETILFVGTKKQATDAVREEASRVGMFYVNARWLGGMLTNFKTIHFRKHNIQKRKTDVRIYFYLFKCFQTGLCFNGLISAAAQVDDNKAANIGFVFQNKNFFHRL